MVTLITAVLLFVAFGLLVVIYACLVQISLRRIPATDQDERGDNNTPTTLTQGDIEKIPSFDFIAKSKGSQPVDCAVCLDNFKAGEKCRLLPLCKHSFHAKCIDEWILKKPVCPICRTAADSIRFEAGEESGHFSDEVQTTEVSSSLSDSSSFQFSAGNSNRIEIGDAVLLNIYGTEEFTVDQPDLAGNHTA